MGNSEKKSQKHNPLDRFKEYPDMKKADLVSRRTFISLAVLGVLGAAGAAVVVSSEKKSKYLSQTAELIKNRMVLEKLLGIQTYFEENKEKFSHIGEKALQNPWGVHKQIKQINSKLQETTFTLDELANTNIRFHPDMFSQALKTIDRMLYKLRNNPKIQDLHHWAGVFSRSRQRTGFVKWIGGYKVDTDAVIALSGDIKTLQANLIAIKNRLSELEDNSIEGYSNNFIINGFIEEKMGPRQSKEE